MEAQELLVVFVASLDVVSVPVLQWMLSILDGLLLGPGAEAMVPQRLLTRVRPPFLPPSFTPSAVLTERVGWGELAGAV